MTEEKRWIIVSDGTAQTMYAGKTRLKEETINARISQNIPIKLTECRALRTLLVPMPNGSVGQKEMVSPIGIARTGICFTVTPSAYFWPDEDELTNRTFKEALKPAEESEMQHRVEAAGLVTAGTTQIGPGGKLIQ